MLRFFFFTIPPTSYYKRFSNICQQEATDKQQHPKVLLILCRMNNAGKVIGLLSLGVIYYLAQAKDFLKGYTVKFITAKLDTGLTQNSGFSKLYFNIKLKISNATEFKGKITGGDIQLSYKGRRIGESQTIPQIDIEPKSEVEIVIPAIIRTSEIVSSLVNVYQLLSTAAPIEFKVTGKINFAAGTYFVNELYQVKI